MNGWRKQDRLASVILVVIFLAGLLDGYRPQLIEHYLLLYTILMSVLVISWLYLDAASFHQKRPKGFAIIASLFFFPIGIWLHLMQTRSPARGTLFTVIVIAVYLSAYIGGFYIGEALA